MHYSGLITFSFAWGALFRNPPLYYSHTVLFVMAECELQVHINHFKADRLYRSFLTIKEINIFQWIT